jgi:hypothetical protein
MMGSVRRAATAALVVLGAVIGIAAVTPAANAATPATLCEASGSFCLGSADLNLNTDITERVPGRNLIETPLGTTFDGFPNVELQFSSDPTKCVAVTNNFNAADIHNCNGGAGIVWAAMPKNGATVFINREASQALGGMWVLAGDNSGTTYFVEPVGGGGFERFIF